MPVKQGDLALLQLPAARELLQSKIPGRLAYVWMDGTPRVIPIWFHWNGSEFVMGTPPKAPKLKALARNPKVSLTIDDNTFPHKVLLIRGTARMEPVEGGAYPNTRSQPSATSDANRDKLGLRKWERWFRQWFGSRLHLSGSAYWISKLGFPALCRCDLSQDSDPTPAPPLRTSLCAN